jgi:hypothetical protein
MATRGLRLTTLTVAMVLLLATPSVNDEGLYIPAHNLIKEVI